MSLIRSLFSPPPMRATTSMTMDDYLRMLTSMDFPPINQTWMMNEEKVEGNFSGLVRTAYQYNGVVFACLMTRFMLFSQIRFQFQQMRGGVPGDLFGTPDLRIVEEPEPGETTSDLLGVAMLDADLSGDWFGVRRPNRIKRLRPDWTTMIIGSPNRDITYPAWDPDAEIAGYSFRPSGPYGPGETWSFDRAEVAHFAPIRDPLSRYRGMPLPTAVLREIRGDSAATTHKLKFFEHNATPNLIVKFPSTMTKAAAEQAIEAFESNHAGSMNAYRTAYLLGGTEIEVVGKDMQQLDFKATQGAGETRIAAALNVQPTIVGLSEGLQGSSLNAGNFAATRRLQADKMLRPAWGSFASSLATIVPPVPGSRLWYDDRNVPFLREDLKDAAEIVNRNMQSIETGVRAGFQPSTIVDAIMSGDLRRLQHTGLYSVQLQPPGTNQPPPSQSSSMVARRDFWPVSGDLTGTQVERGAVFASDHPLVASFPSLFEPAGDGLVIRVRQLREQGMPVAAIAASIDRTERHVRRLLTAG